MITIKDVARRAGTSITSASYALNGNGTISDATRKRVLAAAEELNYHPNAFARHLKKCKTTSIGVFISRFGGSFYDEILEGIHDTVLKTDYELIVCPETRRDCRIFTHRQVDGAIVFDSTIGDELILKLASKRFPIVVLDRYLEAECLCPLLINNQQGAREAFYHLYDQGAHDFAFVSGPAGSFDNRERRKAFFQEARRNNLAVREYHGDFTEQSGYAVAQAIIAAREVPEAVFCANDQMAIGFLRAMSEHGLKVPDDVAVVGFDDILIARYMQPSLSTIGASRFLWGSLAATQLIDFLENEAPLQAQRLGARLIARQSSTRNGRAVAP